MPLPAALLPFLTTAVATGGNYLANRAEERKNKELAKDEREWNLSMWNRQNQYNHPIEQMARLKQAGLNPNMIYGAGAATASGNANDVKGYDRAEATNVMKGIDDFGDFYRFSNIQAQTDNLQSQEEVNRQNAAYTAVKTAGESLGNQQKKLDLGISTQLMDSSVQAGMANAEQAVANARRSKTEADIAELTKDPRVSKVFKELEVAIETLKGKELENKIKDKTVELQNFGVERSDNVVLRMLMTLFGKIDDKGVIMNYLK